MFETILKWESADKLLLYVTLKQKQTAVLLLCHVEECPDYWTDVSISWSTNQFCGEI